MMRKKFSIFAHVLIAAAVGGFLTAAADSLAHGKTMTQSLPSAEAGALVAVAAVLKKSPLE
jgi:hypothetical protein